MARRDAYGPERMPETPFRLVTFDIDGTLTEVHGWLPVAAARHRTADYRRTNRRLLAGEESENTHLRRLFELAEGMRRREFEEVLSRTPKVRGIAATVRTLHDRGCRVALLSHNPAMVADWYCRRFGFDAGSGGWGLAYRAGRVGPPNGVRADKVRGVRELARRFGVNRREICHVGDAWPDARLTPMLGGFVAFNPKAPIVARVADATVRAHDLRRALPAIGALAPHARLKAALPWAQGSYTRNPKRDRPGHGVRRS